MTTREELFINGVTIILIKKEKMKHLVGKEVFLRGTGNNAPRHGLGEKFEKAKIKKVARVYATIIFDGSSYEQKLRIKGNHLDNDCNGGYEVYETEQEIKDYFLSAELALKIFNKYGNPSKFKELDLKTLKKVAELLSV